MWALEGLQAHAGIQKLISENMLQEQESLDTIKTAEASVSVFPE